jgi:hypothetical protein
MQSFNLKILKILVQTKGMLQLAAKGFQCQDNVEFLLK